MERLTSFISRLFAPKRPNDVQCIEDPIQSKTEAPKDPSQLTVRIIEEDPEFKEPLKRIRKNITKRKEVLDVQENFDLLVDEVPKPIPPKKTVKEPKSLLPVVHANRDFFLCDLFDCSWKDDGATMEAPIFTLATKPDLRTWTWSSKDRTRNVKVIPSSLGRATQMDKDVLIFVISQITEGLNRGRIDTSHRKARFTVHNYLVATNKTTSGRDYKRLLLSLNRLTGTLINTDIKTNDIRIKKGFGILDSWEIIEKSPIDETMIAVEVTLSEWLYNSIHAREILTINPDYFRLRKPLERRLYELARKHCGQQAMWKIDLNLLLEKTGSYSSIKEFKRMIKEIIKLDTLLDYRINLDTQDMVTFYTKNTQKLVNNFLKISSKKTLTN